MEQQSDGVKDIEKRPDWVRFFIAAVLTALGAHAAAAYGFHFLTKSWWDYRLFLATFGVAFILYVIATGLLIKARAPSRWTIGAILVIAVPFRIVFAILPPVLSGDIYRYVWDGRVFTHGINPFLYSPNAESLAFLRDTVIYPKVGLPWLQTPYSSVAQLFFAGISLIRPDSVTALKLGLVVADITTMLLLFRITAIGGKHPARVALYAWHPLLLIEVAHSGHIDGLVLPFLVLSVWLALTERKSWSGISLGAAILVKPYLIFIAPALWKRWDWRFPISITATVIAGLALFSGPYLGGLFDGTVFGSAPYLAAHAKFNVGPVWSVLRWFGNQWGWDSDAIIRIIGLLIVAAAGLWAGFSRHQANLRPSDDMARKAWLMIGAFWLVSQQVHPWYLLFGLPFLVLSAPRWAIVFSGLVMLTYLNYYYFPWHLPIWARAMEYIPFYLLFLWNLPRLLYPKPGTAGGEHLSNATSTLP
jgi:alpha-1,6-mannosyltransferase